MNSLEKHLLQKKQNNSQIESNKLFKDNRNYFLYNSISTALNLAHVFYKKWSCYYSPKTSVIC